MRAPAAGPREDRHPNGRRPRSGLRERSVSEASRAVRRSRLAQNSYTAAHPAGPPSSISPMNRSSRIDSRNSLDATRPHRRCCHMQPIAQHECQLRRIDPARNMARFYRVSIGPSLFGDFSVVREWGRIGTIGRVRVDLFEDEHAAYGALEAIERARESAAIGILEDVTSDRRRS